MGDFRVHILGCGSALPTMQHYPTAQVVELRDKLFVVDCGEGAQRQLRRQRLDFGRIVGVLSPICMATIATGSTGSSLRWGCSAAVGHSPYMVLVGSISS